MLDPCGYSQPLLHKHVEFLCKEYWLQYQTYTAEVIKNGVVISYFWSTVPLGHVLLQHSVAKDIYIIALE